MFDFSHVGISVPVNATGDVKVICPQCSHLRRKSNEPCLSVNVDKGVWHCHHCGWSGPTEEDGEEKPKRKVYHRPQYDESLCNLPQHVIDWFNGRNISAHTLEGENIGSLKCKCWQH